MNGTPAIARFWLLLLALSTVSCVLKREANVLPAASQVQAVQSSPHFDTERRWGAADKNRWEPVVAADPRAQSQWVYEMTMNQRPDYLLFRASDDGGATWRPGRHVCRHGVRVPFQYDPQVAVAGNGDVDIVCLDGFRPGVVFSQSRDHGDTWSPAVRLDGTLRYSDKPMLVLSQSGADVYVAYSAGYALYVTSSHDHGRSWSAPVKATASHYWYYPSGGTVMRNGVVWFAIDGETGKNQTGDGHVELVTSSDGGRRWREIPFAVSHEGAACKVKRCYPDFFTAQEAIAADSSGNLVFVFAKNERKHGPNALYVSRSSDGGNSWTNAEVINDRGNTTSTAIVASGTNDFRLVWQDDRYGSKAWNTWYSRSADGGATWAAAVRLSNASGGAPYKHARGYEFPFGDYLGLCVDATGLNFVIWGEGSDVYFPGGTWWTRGI